MKCKNCGGDMIGDGVSLVLHCERVDADIIWELEPDAEPVYCNNEDSLCLTGSILF